MVNRAIFFAIGFILIGHVSFGQSNIFPDSGSVGIGVTSPMRNISNLGLQIAEGAHSSLLLGNPIGSGYGGIVQTTDGKHRVFLGANIYDDQNSSWGSFESGKGSAGVSFVADENGWGTQITFIASPNDGEYKRRMVINGNGNIGIGTNNPDTRLSVNGITKAKEMIVTDQASEWPDYVFDEHHPLQDLDSLEVFITRNKHLPDIPIKQAVEKSGQNLGFIQTKLLRKIEVLTLYSIKLNNQSKEKEEQIEQLKRENRKQKLLIEELFQRVKDLESRN
jgi:hypothetical protein